ncbi:MAG TPA: M23 family metallopeptidase [Geobacteraceae bacterium]|nr:M23 family metallopeptidase [Geobacteraceae bacterium]
MNFLRAITVIIACLLPAVAQAERKSPVDGGVLTSSPGPRLDPFGSGRMIMHNGWDIAVPSGTQVHPTQEGTVYFAGQYRGYGNLVAVEHGKGYISLYGHNSEILVKPGMYVTPKTVIALSGNTGRSTGPHVHYEVRRLPSSYKKQREAELTAKLKEAVSGQIDQLVENFATGKGGPEQEYTYLPSDIDQ